MGVNVNNDSPLGYHLGHQCLPTLAWIGHPSSAFITFVEPDQPLALVHIHSHVKSQRTPNSTSMPGDDAQILPPSPAIELGER